MRFSGRELRDLVAAWVALGLAFTFFLRRDVTRGFLRGEMPADWLGTLVLSMATVGVGFLLHELAHKFVATRFGRIAEFQADYGMLLLAVGSGLAGFIFAAPGAVVHGGRSITDRENGLISVAGPVTNVLLAGAFAVLLFVPGLERVGQLGVSINALLAAFNMLPFGPLDGRKVRAWSTAVFVAVFALTLALAAVAFLYVGTGI
jgi:Zn-dependent protease